MNECNQSVQTEGGEVSRGIPKMVIGNLNPFAESKTREIESYLVKFMPRLMPTVPSSSVIDIIDNLYGKFFLLFQELRYAQRYSDEFGGKLVTEENHNSPSKSPSNRLEEIGKSLLELKAIFADSYEVDQQIEEDFFQILCGKLQSKIKNFITRYTQSDFTESLPELASSESWKCLFARLTNWLENYLQLMRLNDYLDDEAYGILKGDLANRLKKSEDEAKECLRRGITVILNDAKFHNMSPEEARRIEEEYFRTHCYGLRCIIRVIGNGLKGIVSDQKVVVSWRLAFLKLVDRVEDYSCRMWQKDWSCEEEKEFVKKAITDEMKEVNKQSLFIADVLRQKELVSERIGRFLIYRESTTKELVRIAVFRHYGAPPPYERLPPSTVKIIEKLLKGYRLCIESKNGKTEDGWEEAGKGWRQAFQHRDRDAERFYQEQIQRERRDKIDARNENKVGFWRIIPDCVYDKDEFDND